MLNLNQIKKAYELETSGAKRREIADELKANHSEVSHSLNVYKLMLEEFTCKEQNLRDKIAPGVDEKKKIRDEYEKIDEEHERLNEQSKKMLEREAWIKLFVKNIIYKYKSKERELQEEIKRYKNEIESKSKNIEEENFSLYFDLQKETKEKIETLELYEKSQVLKNYYLILSFAGGMLVSFLGLILWQNLDYISM